MIIVKTNLIFINNLQQCLACSNCLTKMSYCYFIVKMFRSLCNLLMGRLLLVFPNYKYCGIKVLYLYIYICKYYQDKFLIVEVLGYRDCTLYQLFIYCLSAKPHPPALFFSQPGLGICKLPFPEFPADLFPVSKKILPN